MNHEDYCSYEQTTKLIAKGYGSDWVSKYEDPNHIAITLNRAHTWRDDWDVDDIYNRIKEELI